jgi:hypothetical protein
MSEYAATDDVILRRVQLEEEEFTGLKSFETAGRRSPEVYLRERRHATQVREPVSIGDRDDESNAQEEISWAQLTTGTENMRKDCRKAGATVPGRLQQRKLAPPRAAAALSQSKNSGETSLLAHILLPPSNFGARIAANCNERLAAGKPACARVTV